MMSVLVSDRFPYLPVRLTVGGRSQEIMALLDTGFDGHVIVPPGPLTAGLTKDGQDVWGLADGSAVTAPYYVGTAAVGDIGPFPILISILGDEPLMGVALIRHFTVILDHGQRVVVEP